jgi:hypothetical protein
MRVVAILEPVGGTEAADHVDPVLHPCHPAGSRVDPPFARACVRLEGSDGFHLVPNRGSITTIICAPKERGKNL